ncbi:MAG: LysR family transcriptional regulator [Alphaproteobacteria bacterium]
MDWNKLKIFHAVFESGSFSAASQALKLSQSSVSRHIRNLEDRLQMPLFFRQINGIVPTEQAEFLYETTQAIWDRLAFIETLLNDGRDVPQGVLRVVSPPAFATLGLALHMPDFLNRYEDLTVEILVDYANQRFYDFRETDVLIHTEPTFFAGILSVPILKQTTGIYASRSYLKAFGAPYRPQQLNQHHLICFDEKYTLPFPRYNLLLELGADTEHPRQPFIKINSLLGIARAVEEGLGIALLPPFVAATLSDVAQIIPEVSCPTVEFTLSYPEQLKKASRVQAFQEFLLEKIGGKTCFEEMVPKR